MKVKDRLYSEYHMSNDTNPENSGFNNFRLQHNVTQVSENLFIDTRN